MAEGRIEADHEGWQIVVMSVHLGPVHELKLMAVFREDIKPNNISSTTAKRSMKTQKWIKIQCIDV